MCRLGRGKLRRDENEPSPAEIATVSIQIGLDYHYDSSPREKQQEVLIRQLKHAVRLNKPITIHTREADDDIWRILSEHLPKEQRLHIHCFTDSPELADKLLGHFPNCWIGVTGAQSARALDHPDCNGTNIR